MIENEALSKAEAVSEPSLAEEQEYEKEEIEDDGREGNEPVFDGDHSGDDLGDHGDPDGDCDGIHGGSDHERGDVRVLSGDDAQTRACGSDRASGGDGPAADPEALRKASDEEGLTVDRFAVRREAMQGARAELMEFAELYPEVALSEIPSVVRDSELPLAAAYALFEKREARLRERAAAENLRNAERSAGGVSDGERPFYSPEEVRRMTQSEVRAHYTDILRSMEKWR